MTKIHNDQELLAAIRQDILNLEAYYVEPHDVSVKLDQNENTYGIPDLIRNQFREALNELSPERYPDLLTIKIQEAIGEISRWLPAGILIGNGSNDLLLLLVLTIVGQGKSVVHPNPSFPMYSYATRLTGGFPVGVELDENLEYDIDAFLSAIKKRDPSLVFICSPNNPTGCTLDPDELRSIASASTGVVVIDEAYWEFSGRNARQLLDSHRNVVLLRTFSKAMAMAGLRIGYLMADPLLRDEFAKAQLPYTVNQVSRAAVLAASNNYGLVLEMARVIAAERDRMFSALQTFPMLRVYPSAANFILIQVSSGAKTVFDGLIRKGILVRDFSAHPLLPQMLRISVGRPEENNDVLEALGELLGDP